MVNGFGSCCVASLASIFVAVAVFPGAASAQQTSVEGCVGCHALGEQAQVGMISTPADLHHIDLDSDGPETPSTYRQLNISISSVDVTGSSAIIDFSVADENGAAVANIFDTDGRLVIAKLDPGVVPGVPATSGDPTQWQRLVQEDFDDGGSFQYLGGPDYRLVTLFDPSLVPIATGETLRAAIQLSASDIPAGNGWCDFDADLVSPNDCVSGTALTRDIVQTATCNGCHGVTSDTKLAFHRDGGRTEVEYCVVCHNPDRNPETGFTTLVHKIHYGSQLTQEWLGGDFDNVTFTKDIDNCTSCHEQGGFDQFNWKTEPNREACGSCHDDVNFDTGLNHSDGGQQPNNRFCSNCHPSDGPITDSTFPVSAVHQGVARAQEGAQYRGAGNGIAIESATFDRVAETLTVDFSVTRAGQKMSLQTDPRWANGARLGLDVAWSTDDYTNEGSDSTPAPAQPIGRNLLDVGGAVSDLGNGSYRTVVDVSTFGFDGVGVGIEGHPQADLLGMGQYSAIPVKSAVRFVSFEPRVPLRPRRQVIDIAKCNACHDSGGAGISLHGTNRTGEMQVCVMCHNPNATDIRRRPLDPGTTPDGKVEESVDMKRMIHMIHMGGDLEEPLVVYGFGGSVHDYAGVEFIGNNKNCLTCHRPGTYSTDDAWTTLPSTIDSGADVTDPADDLNISPVTAVCSSCHDSDRAKDHMRANGGSFGAFDLDILIPAPEPGGLQLSLAALCTMGLLARRRLRRYGRR